MPAQLQVRPYVHLQIRWRPCKAWVPHMAGGVLSEIRRVFNGSVITAQLIVKVCILYLSKNSTSERLSTDLFIHFKIRYFLKVCSFVSRRHQLRRYKMCGEVKVYTVVGGGRPRCRGKLWGR